MNGVKYCLIKKNNSYIIEKIDKGLELKEEENIFSSLYELFAYLFNCNETLSFFDIFKIFTLNNLEFNKSEFVKYFISNSDFIKNAEEEIYIKIKINKGSIYEILSILPKSLSAKRNVKGASLTLKINKQFIPFYLAIFIKDYTIEDYYSTSRDLFGDSRLIPFIDLYNHNREYYVVKNRDKIVYIATTKKMADYYIELISSIRKDNSLYFVPNIELISGFKNLINFLKIHNPNINVNAMKNLVDFTGSYSSYNARNTENDSLVDKYNKSYVIKTKNGDYVLKNNVDEIFDFIVENKIYDPELMEVCNMERVISRREVLKSIFLVNTVDESEKLYALNGISILEGDNLIKIYSNIVNIFLLKRTSSPYTAVILNEEKMKYDVLFFFDENSMNMYIENEKGKIKLLSSKVMSLESVKNKLIEKNLEILMTENENFNPIDVAINLSGLYRTGEKASLKIKRLDEIPCIIDVDSSLDGDMACCGIVLRGSSNKILGKISRELNAKTSVEAEIRGAMHAIKYAIMEDFTEICLRYDYIGIFEYLVSIPSTDIAKEYQEFFRKIVNNNEIEIYFKKVKAHSLDEYNELADYLAGNLNVNESFFKTN